MSRRLVCRIILVLSRTCFLDDGATSGRRGQLSCQLGCPCRSVPWRKTTLMRQPLLKIMFAGCRNANIRFLQVLQRLPDDSASRTVHNTRLKVLCRFPRGCAFYESFMALTRRTAHAELCLLFAVYERLSSAFAGKRRNSSTHFTSLAPMIVTSSVKPFLCGTHTHTLSISVYGCRTRVGSLQY